MKALKVVVCLLLLLLGFAWGCFIQKYPLIKFNPEVKLFEVLSLILTASIGLLIPFFIKKWIEDGRYLKNNLVNEMREALSEVSIVRNKIKNCYANGSIDSKEKQFIIVQFEEIDLKMSSLGILLSEFSSSKTKPMYNDIKVVYLNYWKISTGDEIMSDTFSQINDRFYKLHNETFINFETKVKQCINKIHLF